MAGDIPGPESALNEESCIKMRECVLNGGTDDDLAKLCGVSINTVIAWKSRNYKSFYDKWLSWKQEWRLQRAEKFGDKLMGLTDEEKILQLKQKEAEFIRETLGKKHYSKRSELTGEGGKDLIPKGELDKVIANLTNQNCDKKQGESTSSEIAT